MTEKLTWWPKNPPIYDIDKTYDENFDQGPFFNEVIPSRLKKDKSKWHDFLGFKVASRLGVPAGPLLNSKWTTLAAKLGFDIVTYKTIRSSDHPCQAAPNMIYVNTKGALSENRLTEKLNANTENPTEIDSLAVTNSFGMPSKDKDYLLKDIAKANEQLEEGQVMIVSTVATPRQGEDFVKDFCQTASIAKEAGAKIIEANFSCPNVTTGEGSIYTNPETVKEIVTSLVKEIGDIPLIIKVGYFTDEKTMKEVFITAASAGVRAICGINTIGMEVVNDQGEPALGQGRLKSGICGHPIQNMALDYIRKAKQINETEKLDLTLIGCGGITMPEQFTNFFIAGADIVMSATGMMWNPYLALNYHN